MVRFAAIAKQHGSTGRGEWAKAKMAIIEKQIIGLEARRLDELAGKQ